MAGSCDKKGGPVVSVLIPTHNREQVLPFALSSVVCQDYENLEIIVIRDGGQDVREIVESFGDSRIVFINRQLNLGKAYSLNEGLSRATGKYVAYIDDDDLYYPCHIGTLVDALERRGDFGVAYSDLYQTNCRVEPNGSRVVLSKVVEISRDFDRFLMLYYNHVLHVSLMHRRNLLEKAGPYNEDLTVLIDWDMTRRLSFFSDFYHVPEITGEFYCPVGDCDRVSIQRRKDKNEYYRNVTTIRTSRPGKPWSKIGDLSIIFTAERCNEKALDTLGMIWRRTFYPYEIYWPLPEPDMSKFRTDIPNVVCVPVDPGASESERVDAAIGRCDGDYVVIAPQGFSIDEFWVEDSLYGLINNSVSREAFELEGSTDESWAVVIRREDLKYSRECFGELPLRESLTAAGVSIRRLRPDEIPFQFDQLLLEANSAERLGDWSKAAEIFEYLAEYYRNELWMKTRAAKAFFAAADHAKAASLSGDINRRRPTVDTLLLEAKVNREQGDLDSAIGLLERAEQILEGKELIWT